MIRSLFFGPSAPAGAELPEHAPRFSWQLWLPSLLFCLAFLGLQLTPWLDPAVLLDDTRQFGAPLALPVSTGALLFDHPQIAYFQDATPRLYALVAQGWMGVTGLPPAQALKTLALLVGLSTVAVWVRFARSFAPGLALQPGLLALFLVGNALCSTQVLSGTPRDFGTLLAAISLVCWMEQRWIGLGLALLLLAGCYPAYALVLLSALWLLQILRLRQVRWARLCTWAPVLLATVLTGLGLKMFGPHLDAQQWGEALRLFSASGAEDWGVSPEVISPRSPAATYGLTIGQLLDTQRFRPWPGSGRLLRSLPIWILSLFGGLAVVVSRYRHPPDPPQPGEAAARLDQPLACSALQLLVTLLATGLFWYVTSFAMAYGLHSPSRYLILPVLLLLSLAEAQLAQLLLAFIPALPWRSVAVAVLAVVLGITSVPQGHVVISVNQMHQLAKQLQLKSQSDTAAHRSPVLAVIGASQGRRQQDLASSLPLVAGIPVLYAPELDRAFHVKAMNINSQLLATQARLDQAIDSDQRLPFDSLSRHHVTHLLSIEKPKRSFSPEMQKCAIRIDAHPSSGKRAGESFGQSSKDRSWWLFPIQCLRLASDEPS